MIIVSVFVGRRLVGQRRGLGLGHAQHRAHLAQQLVGAGPLAGPHLLAALAGAAS